MLGALVETTNPSSVTLVRFDQDGVRLGATILGPVENTASNLSLRWVGDRFLAVWIDTNTTVVHVAEVDVDGSLGHTYQFTSADFQGSFNRLHGLAATATTYAVAVNYGYEPHVMLIDRTTGQSTLYLGWSDFAYGILISRGDAFEYTASFSHMSELMTFDATGVEGPLVHIPFDADGNFPLPTSTGFHLIGAGLVGTTMYDISQIDLDPSGSAADAQVQIATTPAASRWVGIGGVSRGDGFAATFSDGSGAGIDTEHLIQTCNP